MRALPPMRPHTETGTHGAPMSALPEDLLLQIFGLLSARDLAALSVQDSYLRRVASEPALWQPLALARWPGACSTDQYGGDWHALYQARAPLPLAFPLAVDRVRTLTEAQQQRDAVAAAEGGGNCSASGGSSSAAGEASTAAAGRVPGGALAQMAFEDTMRQVFSVGLACGMNRAVRRTGDWRGLKRDLAWWGAHRPEVVVAFVRGAHELLAGGGSGWGASATALPRGWADTPWRRSAVAYLQDLGLLTGAHASVANRVAAEAAALDCAMRSVRRQAGAAAAAAPQGVSASHWWFS